MHVPASYFKDLASQQPFGSFGAGPPTLRRGSRGADVVKLQKLLGIKADGVYGSNTQTAVAAFQRSRGLSPDGVVDPTTWAAIGVGTGAPAARPTTAARPPAVATLRQGSKGPAVQVLQQRLNELGFGPLKVDGAFGAGTKTAVVAFQRAAGVSADGIVGPGTMAALRSAPVPSGPRKTAPVPASKTVPGKRAPSAASATLRQGARGPAVKVLQERLNSLGYGPQTLATDGVFGAGTTAAVKAFQRVAGVTADGIVGPSTQAALRSMSPAQGMPPVTAPPPGTPPDVIATYYPPGTEKTPPGEEAPPPGRRVPAGGEDVDLPPPPPRMGPPGPGAEAQPPPAEGEGKKPFPTWAKVAIAVVVVGAIGGTIYFVRKKKQALPSAPRERYAPRPAAERPQVLAPPKKATKSKSKSKPAAAEAAM